jgi:hypothetical protein
LPAPGNPEADRTEIEVTPAVVIAAASVVTPGVRFEEPTLAGSVSVFRYEIATRP